MDIPSFDRNFDDKEWDVLVQLLLDTKSNLKALTDLKATCFNPTVEKLCWEAHLDEHQPFGESAAYLSDSLCSMTAKLDLSLQAMGHFYKELDDYLTLNLLGSRIFPRKKGVRRYSLSFHALAQDLNL